MSKKTADFINQNKPFLIFYLIFGAITAGIYFSVFTIFYEYFHLNYNIAISIAYMLAVTFHFIVNRRVTFKAHGHALNRQLLKYLVMLGINYGITLLVMYIIVYFSLSPYLGMVFSIGVTIVSGYLIAKIWVFHIPQKN